MKIYWTTEHLIECERRTMQEDWRTFCASGYKCFDSGILDELQCKKIREEVDMFCLKSERASASSFARQKEMIELKLKQTELRLELQLAQEQAERIRKEAGFRRLKREIELEKKRTELQMELLKLKEAMSSSSRSNRKKQLQCRDDLDVNSPDESGCGMGIGKNVSSLPPGNAVSTREATSASCIILRPPAITIDRNQLLQRSTRSRI